MPIVTTDIDLSIYEQYTRLRFEQPADADGVLLITLDDPEKYNATDGAMHLQLSRVFRTIDDDESMATMGSPAQASPFGTSLPSISASRGHSHRPATARVIAQSVAPRMFMASIRLDDATTTDTSALATMSL